jgi:hypothetical protein
LIPEEQPLELKPTVLFGFSDLPTQALDRKLVLTDRGSIRIRISQKFSCMALEFS